MCWGVESFKTILMNKLWCKVVYGIVCIGNSASKNRPGRKAA